ncbi:MAG TPA: MFS transporter [Novosphingobium sp.]
MDRSTSLAKQEWSVGWTLVLAAALGFSFFSVLIAAVGLFMEPLGKEFGWSRTLLSAGPSIATSTTAILGPFLGAIVDRYGTRRVVLPGLLLTIAALGAFAFIDGSETQWLLLWGLFGFVSVSIKSTPWTAAVVSMFEKSRGLALGMTLAGTAVAQALVPPLGNWLIVSFGWRAAFVWLALGWGGITFVVCLLFFRGRHERRSAAEKAAAAAATPEALPGLTIAQAWRNSVLWRIAISNFIVMVLTMGLLVHLFPILTEAGVSRTTAAWLTGLSGLAGIAGKLVTGVLLDRFRPNWVGGLTLAAAALAFALLMDGVRSPTLILIALLVNGYTAGTKTHITGYLTASYGGMRNFGAIYGVMSSLMALASGVGPLLAGRIYDTMGGYEPFLLAGSIGTAIGGLIIVTLPPYPEFAETRTASAEEEAEARA